jgi:hypothetical protein
MVAGVAQTGTGSAEPTAPDSVGTTERVATVCCCVLAVALALIATWKGPGLSNDSVAYLSAGVNIADSHGVTTLDDRSLTVFPPGLPVIAAIGETVGLGVEMTARLVSVVSFGAMVLLGNVMLRRVVRDRRAVIALTALLAVAPALLGVSKMAWSEPPFIVVSLIFLLVLCRVWERRALSGFDLVALSVLCWVGFLLRYVGASLIVVGAVTLLAALRPVDRRTLGRIVVFGALAVSVPILWMLRNHAADGTYLGPRAPSPDSFWDVVERTAAVIGEWVVPVRDMSTRSLALVGLAALILVAAALARIEWPRQGRAGAVLVCCCIFIPIYVGWMTVSSLTTAINPTNSRFLSPVFVPLLVVAAAAAAQLIARSDRAVWRGLVGAVLAVGLAGYVAVSVRDVRDDAADGIQLNSDAVVDSDLAATALQSVRTSPDGAVVYSNNPNALWSATSMQPIYFAPRDLGVRGRQVSGQLNAFARQLACTSDPSYLVFYLITDDRYVDLDEIRKAVDVQRVEGGDRGVLFRVSAKPGAACTAEGAHPVRQP